MKTNTFKTLDGRGMRIAIAAARFNADIADRLLAGAEAALAAAGVAKRDMAVFRVPGSFELAQTAGCLAVSGAWDAVVCLGCIIKGETDHDVYIAEAVSRGLTDVSLRHGLPVLFGVLTCNTRAQAEARVDGLGEKNKGYEAAMSAIEMVQRFREGREGV